jgi:integrase
VSLPTYIQMVCALRFLYTHTWDRKIAIERIPFPRRERRLPLILSREEVKALLEAPRNLRCVPIGNPVLFEKMGINASARPFPIPLPPPVMKIVLASIRITSW